MSLLSGPSVHKPKVSDALRKRSEEKRETVSWSPRRKCPFNQTSAKIPLPSPVRKEGHRIDRWTDVQARKNMPEFAALRAPRSEGRLVDTVWTKRPQPDKNSHILLHPYPWLLFSTFTAVLLREYWIDLFLPVSYKQPVHVRLFPWLSLR